MPCCNASSARPSSTRRSSASGQVLRDFNSHDQWHDVVDQSRIEGGERSDQVGCVRSFTPEGRQPHPRAAAHARRTANTSSTYCIVEATVPLQRYVATVTLKPVTDGDRTFWHWESTFATPPGMERELRDDGRAGRLRGRLREPAPAPARAAGTLRAHGTAAPDARGRAAARRASVRVRRYGGADLLHARGRRSAGPPGPGEVRIRAARDRRQLHRRLPAPRLGAGHAAAARRAGHGGRRQRARRRRRRQRPAARRPRRLPGPGPGAYCERAHRAGRPGRAAAARRSRTTYRRRAAAQGHHRRLPAARPRPRAAAARGCWCMRRPAASACCCAPGRAGWARPCIGTVSSDEKARIAREHGCEHVDRHARLPLRRRGAAPGRRCRRDRRRPGRRRARREPAALALRGHWISLGQASGPLRRSRPTAAAASRPRFSRPVVFDYVADPRAAAPNARSACGMRWPTAR